MCADETVYSHILCDFVLTRPGAEQQLYCGAVAGVEIWTPNQVMSSHDTRRVGVVGKLASGVEIAVQYLDLSFKTSHELL